MADIPPRFLIFTPEMVEEAMRHARQSGAIGDDEEARVVERVVLEKFDRTPQSEEEAPSLLIERLTFQDGVLVNRYVRGD